MKALSIRQPWSYLILTGQKDIENRLWPTKFRGEFLIHAPKIIDRDAWKFIQGDMGLLLPPLNRMNKMESLSTEKPDYHSPWHTGGIVGIAEIVDCVTQSDSPWFSGPYGFVIQNPRCIPFIPLAGNLRFFEVDYLIDP